MPVELNMNREETIRKELLEYVNSDNEDFTVNSIVRFIRDNCFCENCECNAPHYPWDRKE